ncbi:hypothetical protein GS597_07640 [Synechococcales cyanobacterium C]|uniref:Uncharacterized protein n=1 Tax=Petrachloros mirabilis ULC683 TaxID=2781853 RepID=A0A8K2A7N5_9CYAN|nr:hypothetical protein [Petrachloros mirabilis]NCJ06384.1 hypothetical protein [Petrachloros mirabilis ULC683]
MNSSETPNPSAPDTLDLSTLVQGLQTRLQAAEAQLEVLHLALSRAQPVASTVGSPAGEGETQFLLDLALEQVLDCYQESPQLLSAYAISTSLTSESLHNLQATPELAADPLGQYWVLRIQDGGEILVPRPRTQNLARLNTLQQLFTVTGEGDDWCLQAAARVQTVQRCKRWQLQNRGQIQLGESALQFQWQQRLRRLEQEYQEIIQNQEQLQQLLQTATQGDGGIQTKLSAQQRRSQLQKQYGEPRRILVNTCAPQAYAVYEQDTVFRIVPCNVDLSAAVQVMPATDQSIDWRNSMFGHFHRHETTEVTRARADHPYLPRQPYLCDESGQTWVMAENWEAAERVLVALKGNWMALD